MPISDRLAELGELARRAGKIAQDLRGRVGFGRDLKPDGSIVTEADRNIEQMLRGELPRLVPDSTVWGEEYGAAEEGPGGLWVVDPVDGTSNFSFGGPLWGISIALVVGPEVEIGAIFLPDLQELYLAERGCGAYLNGHALPPIPPGPVRPEELVDYTDGVVRKIGMGIVPGKMRLHGAFVIAGAFTATQRIRGLVGHKEQLYDIGAAVLMCLELGAEVRYADGSPFEIEPLTRPGSIGRPWIIFPRDSGFIAK